MNYVKTHWHALAIGLVVGIVFGSKIRSAPVINKVPIPGS
jgi:uncharacterized membrane-anchored protein YhcB (DUF1043 family)